MEKRDLKIGDLLQIKREHKFGGFLVVVTDIKSFGCQGYLMSAYDFKAARYNGRAYVRVNFEEVEYVGHLEWIEREEN
jgi:hypothetical protein